MVDLTLDPGGMMRLDTFRVFDGYYLVGEEDVVVLSRRDGSPVGQFSSRGVATERVWQAIEDDRRGYPLYGGPDEHADAVRRYLRVRMESKWERFLDTERRMLRARDRGQLARALLHVLPHESREDVEWFARWDRFKAHMGLVELRGEDGWSRHKNVEQLVPGDRRARMAAELKRLEWLLRRQTRRNVFLRRNSPDAGHRLEVTP